MESEDLLYTSINSDHTILTTGSHSGFKVFQLHPLAVLQESNLGNFKIVEPYESSQLLILVGAGDQPAFSPRRLSIFNIPNQEVICETTFDESVLSVKVNKMRIAVATIDKLYIYNTSTMKTLAVLSTAENPKGLIALSPSHSECYLLFPASHEKGLVQVYDSFTMQNRSIIEAHNSQLAYITISYQGHLCATASIKGTMIRVFSLPEGNKLFSFKRGILTAEIYSISFGVEGYFVVAASSTGTIHVYDIRNNSIRRDLTWKATIRSSLVSAASYVLPESYRDSLDTARSFAMAKVHYKKKFVAGLLPGSAGLVAVSCSGEVSVFQVDLTTGGEATLSLSTHLHQIPHSQSTSLIQQTKSNEKG